MLNAQMFFTCHWLRKWRKMIQPIIKSRATFFAAGNMKKKKTLAERIDTIMSTPVQPFMLNFPNRSFLSYGLSLFISDQHFSISHGSLVSINVANILKL